eukprot:7806967-Alexandrium_andersonii.AAC.1
MRSGRLLAGQYACFKCNALSCRMEFMHLEQTFSELYVTSWTLRSDEGVVRSLKRKGTDDKT